MCLVHSSVILVKAKNISPLQDTEAHGYMDLLCIFFNFRIGNFSSEMLWVWINSSQTMLL